MGSRDHGCPQCGRGGMNEPPCQDCARLKAEVERLKQENATMSGFAFVAEKAEAESAALKAEVERLTAQAGILMENESIARSESAALREQLETEKAYARTLMRNLGRMIALTQGPDAHMIAKDLSLPLVEDVIGQAVRAPKREVL